MRAADLEVGRFYFMRFGCKARIVRLAEIGRFSRLPSGAYGRSMCMGQVMAAVEYGDSFRSYVRRVVPLRMLVAEASA